MGPGATAFTLMPLLKSWLDRARVNATWQGNSNITTHWQVSYLIINTDR